MGLEHPWVLVFATSPGIKSLRIPRDIIMQYDDATIQCRCGILMCYKLLLSNYFLDLVSYTRYIVNNYM